MSSRGIVRHLAWMTVPAACLLAAIGAAWGDRPAIVVVMTETPPPETGVIETSLAQHSFELGDVQWRSLAATGYVATATVDRTDAELADALDWLRARDDIIAAGELLNLSSASITFFSGELLVKFRSQTAERVARQWGVDRDLVWLDQDSTESVSRFKTKLRPASVLALLQGAVSPAVARIDPIVPSLWTSPGPTFTGMGVYQRIPRNRDQLVVLLDSPDSADSVLREVGIDRTDYDVSPDKLALTISFGDEGTMLRKQQTLRGMAEVLRVGPLVSRNALAFMTDQLIVKFQDSGGPQKAETLLATLGLVETGPLPYIENGHVFRYREPSYEIYEAARHLLLGGYAVYAVPNLVSANALDGCDDSCGAGLPPRLNVLQLCEPWSPTNPAEWPIKVGLLDSAIKWDDTETCSRLNVDHIVDFDYLDPCDPTGSWCDCDFANTSNISTLHGTSLALTIGATTVSGDSLQGIAQGVPIISARTSRTPARMTDRQFADALVWLAGGDPGWCWDGTNYFCPIGDRSTTYDCTATYPEPVCPEQWPILTLEGERAAVINLSTTREDFITVEDLSDVPADGCPGTGCDPEDPQLVGIDPDLTHPVVETLTNLTTGGYAGVRSGGVVIVNSVGERVGDCGWSRADPECFENDTPYDWDPCGDPLTDLAVHEATIGVGSVREESRNPPDWRPTESNKACFIQHRGEFLDVVAPTLDDGESSMAAGVVTGVVALMLRQDPDMPAAQVECLLKETARRFDKPGEMWHDFSKWETPDCCNTICSNDDQCCEDECSWAEETCDFDGEHSPCVGHGMISACQAVSAAHACATNPASAACLCTESGDPKPTCNSSVDLEASTCRIIVTECDDPSDPAMALLAGVVSSRTTVLVVNSAGEIRDRESGLRFDPDDVEELKFVAKLPPLTSGTARDVGSGALELRDGDFIRVVYRDQTDGIADPGKERTVQAFPGCEESPP